MKRFALTALILFCSSCASRVGTSHGSRSALQGLSAVDRSVDPRIAHVVLNDEVTDESMGGVIKDIVRALDAGAQGIVLEINSPGGSVDAGFQLAKALEISPVPVVCAVDGQADSMAFYILQSCQVRTMTKRSVLMAHQPALNGSAGGQENEWRNKVDWLAALGDAMAEHITHRMKVTVDEYKKRTSGGSMWWFNWQDAVKYGAVDGVLDNVSDAARLCVTLL